MMEASSRDGWMTDTSSSLPLQWVLAFEIFIPLVLFFILLGLRQKKPAIAVKEGGCGSARVEEEGGALHRSSRRPEEGLAEWLL